MPDIRVQLRGAPWNLLKRFAALAKSIATGEKEKQVLEIVVSGPGGTGKTRGITTVLWWLGHRYPGIRILVLRDVRADLSNSFQKTFEEDVVPPDHPMLKKAKVRGSRRAYNFYNGPNANNPTVGATVIELGGMDNVARHRSTDYDVVYFLELVEHHDEGAWSEFRRALRNWKMPFQLLIADTNPDAPDHWVKLRAERGDCELIETDHRENPKFYDAVLKTWTPEGAAYIDSLDRLHGIRKERLRYGRWVAAEGVVYPQFSRHTHLTLDPIDALNIKWYAASMDWGYRDACVMLIGGVTAEGRVYIVAEWYMTEKQLDWWAARVAEANRKYKLYGMVVDPSKAEAVDRFNLELGYTKDRPWARAADNVRTSTGDGDFGGIDLVRSYLSPMSDGKPGVIFLADRMQHDPDPNLVLAKKCFNTVMEFPSYTYRKSPTSGAKLATRMGELTDPHCDDHGMDSLRYLLKFVRGRDGGTGIKPQDPKKMDPEQERLARAMGRL